MTTISFDGYGLPPEENDTVYGLYSPATDCFVGVEYNLRVATHITYLMSSKIFLFLVNLNSAKNYKLNLIDNTVCENWTISDIDKIADLMPDCLGNEYQIDALENIVKEKNLHIAKLKEWAKLCAFWSRVIFTAKELIYSNSKIDDFLNNFLDLDVNYGISDIEKKVYTLLYFSKDPNTTHQNILSIVKQHPVLFQVAKDI